MSALCGVCPCTLGRPSLVSHNYSSVLSHPRCSAEALSRLRDVHRSAFSDPGSFWQSMSRNRCVCRRPARGVFRHKILLYIDTLPEDTVCPAAGLFRRTQCEVASEPLTQEASAPQPTDEVSIPTERRHAGCPARATHCIAPLTARWPAAHRAQLCRGAARGNSPAHHHPTTTIEDRCPGSWKGMAFGG